MRERRWSISLLALVAVGALVGAWYLWRQQANPVVTPEASAAVQAVVSASQERQTGLWRGHAKRVNDLAPGITRAVKSPDPARLQAAIEGADSLRDQTGAVTIQWEHLNQQGRDELNKLDLSRALRKRVLTSYDQAVAVEATALKQLMTVESETYTELGSTLRWLQGLGQGFTTAGGEVRFTQPADAEAYRGRIAKIGTLMTQDGGATLEWQKRKTESQELLKRLP